MKDKTMKKVEAQLPFRKKERFDFSHDVNTSNDFGVVAPVTYCDMMAGSKVSMDMEQLCRPGPILAPYFGRIDYEVIGRFVAYEKLLHSYPFFKTKASCAFGGFSYVPQSMPNMSLGLLSQLCLAFAKCSIWVTSRTAAESDDDIDHSLAMLPVYDVSTAAARATNSTKLAVSVYKYITGQDTSHTGVIYNVDDSAGSVFGDFGGPGSNGHSPTLDLGLLFNSLTLTSAHYAVPSGNFGTVSFFEPSEGYRNAVNPSVTGGFDLVNSVSLKAADYVHSVTVTISNWEYDEELEKWVEDVSDTSDLVLHFAFRLSDFGARFRRNLIHLGYQLNMKSAVNVDLLPLMAEYKAYWDDNHNDRKDMWEQTNLCKFCRSVDVDGWLGSGSNVSHDFPDLVFYKFFPTFFDWLFEFGNQFSVDDVDFVSCQMLADTNATNDLSGYVNGDGINVDVDMTPNISTDQIAQNAIYNGGSNTENGSSASGHMYFTAAKHGWLDDLILKWAYRNVNLQTVAGKVVSKLLACFGFGRYLLENMSSFVGREIMPIDASSVRATSDTLNPATGTGSLLGEYGGSAIGYKGGFKKWEYSTDVDGFFVVLSCIKPRGGYCQAIDGRRYNVKLTDQYDIETDSFGYEGTRKSQVCGSIEWTSNSEVGTPIDMGFGLIPRHMEYKVRSNILGGDVSRRSVRSEYLPYVLDKVMHVNEREVRENGLQENAGSSYLSANYYKIFKAYLFPEATPEIWRFTSKFAFLNNFRRIFANVKRDNLDWRVVGENVNYWDEIFLYLVSGYDNFLLHHVVHMDYWAPMLPIAKSYGTIDDDGKPNTTMHRN